MTDSNLMSRETAAAKDQAMVIVDCDVHPIVPMQAITSRMSNRARQKARLVKAGLRVIT